MEARREEVQNLPTLPSKKWDPNSSGSRFTWRPAVVVLAGEVSEADRSAGRTKESVVSDVLGEWVLKKGDLGKPAVIDGGIGRGAEGWAPVLEWLGDAAGSGVIGTMSWKAAKSLSKGAARLIGKIREREADRPRIYVSRGLAVLLAIDAVLAENDSASVAVEAADEPSGFGGRPTHELNYVGLEPWIVLLVDLKAERRWVVAVRPSGQIAATMSFPLEEYEGMFLPIDYPPS